MTRYLTDREWQTGEKYVGIATDGADFIAFFLQRDRVVEVGSHRTEPRTPRELLAWLQCTVAVGDGLQPDPETITREFGRESLAARRALDWPGSDPFTRKRKRRARKAGRGAEFGLGDRSRHPPPGSGSAMPGDRGACEAARGGRNRRLPPAGIGPACRPSALCMVIARLQAFPFGTSRFGRPRKGRSKESGGNARRHRQTDFPLGPI